MTLIKPVKLMILMTTMVKMTETNDVHCGPSGWPAKLARVGHWNSGHTVHTL